MNENRKIAAEKYLAKLLDGMEYPRTEFKSVVLEGNPVSMLADYAAANTVDLMVIASHGRSGISRWVMGSVAERIVRTSCVPVMMIRAPGCELK